MRTAGIKIILNTTSKLFSYRNFTSCPRFFTDQFIVNYSGESEVVVLDCDDTDPQIFGDQRLNLFNNYYDGYLFYALHNYEGLSGNLITSILKPGGRGKWVNVFGILRRVIPQPSHLTIKPYPAVAVFRSFLF